MKILFVLENYLPHIGGVEVVFMNLMEGLAKLGHDVSVVTHRIKGTKKYEIINDVKVYRVNCFYSRHLFTFLSIPLVRRLAKESDLIHTTTYNAAFPSKVASLMTKKKCIITVHEVLGKLWHTTDVSFIGAKILQFLEKMIIKLNFDKYVCVSNSTKHQVLKENVKLEKVMTIYNGVDYNFWNSKKYDGSKIREKYNLNDDFVYFFYGRPGVSKGLEFLIKAIPQIKNDLPNSKFFAVVSKDKTYIKRYNYILELIEKLNIKDNIIFHDPVSYKELPNFVKMADLVVVPSLTEGFGFTTAESCAMGKIVVCSNTTSLPEVVSGKYKLVKIRDSKAIAKAVIDAVNGKYDTKPLKKFTLDENIDNYLNLYDSLLK